MGHTGHMQVIKMKKDCKGSEEGAISEIRRESYS